MLPPPPPSLPSLLPPCRAPTKSVFFPNGKVWWQWPPPIVDFLPQFYPASARSRSRHQRGPTQLVANGATSRRICITCTARRPAVTSTLQVRIPRSTSSATHVRIRAHIPPRPPTYGLLPRRRAAELAQQSRRPYLSPRTARIHSSDGTLTNDVLDVRKHLSER